MADPVVWQSVRWPDGSSYEGLVKDDKCHIRGVFGYSSGDKYMGEFMDNAMDGLGVYRWSDGTVYRGEWKNSMMHGCGVKITKQPNGRYIAEEGEFVNDEWAGNVMGCSIAEARKAAAQADAAAQMAMAFELRNPKPPTAPAKPAGADATLTTSRQEKARGKFDPGKYLQQRAEAAGQLLQGGRQGLQNLHNPVQDLWEKAQAKFSGLSKPAATN